MIWNVVSGDVTRFPSRYTQMRNANHFINRLLWVWNPLDLVDRDTPGWKLGTVYIKVHLCVRSSNVNGDSLHTYDRFA
jgi:hypothetical protein